MSKLTDARPELALVGKAEVDGMRDELTRLRTEAVRHDRLIADLHQRAETAERKRDTARRDAIDNAAAAERMIDYERTRREQVEALLREVEFVGPLNYCHFCGNFTAHRPGCRLVAAIRPPAPKGD